jgi:thioredoxin reductase
MYDVVIVGGGPAGLSGALALGRARRRVLVCDAGPRRNAAATHIHGFLTQDGTPPEELRRIARKQLEPYPVEFRDEPVEAVAGERGSFEVSLPRGRVQARRILLATGMIDVLPEIEGFRELWGKSIFICPYCHAWEVQDRKFAFLTTNGANAEFADFLRAWTDDVIVLDQERIRRVYDGGAELTDGKRVDVDVFFIRPPQRQVPVVASLGVALDANGYVSVNEQRQTSVAGVFAGGDLIMPMQSAIYAAAAGYGAAAMLNHDLTSFRPLSHQDASNGPD